MESKGIILLVEDNPLDIELTMNAFRELKMVDHVQVARSGEEALDYLFGQGDFSDRERFPLPSLILLDLKLPGISGFDVLHRLKSEERLKRLPVVVLTSSHDEEDRIRAYDSGTNSYLVKPISFSGFLEGITLVKEYWLKWNVNAPLHHH